MTCSTGLIDSNRACKIVYEITAGLSEKNKAWRERGTSVPKPRSRRQTPVGAHLQILVGQELAAMHQLFAGTYILDKVTADFQALQLKVFCMQKCNVQQWGF